MAQNFTPDWYELSYNVDTAFQNAENNDNVLRSNFSGSTAPSSPIAGQQWFDIDTGTMKVYEIDAQWIASLVGGADFKTWLYTNDQQRGMLIDTSVTDVVLALRGGNYGASGGVVVGDWNHASGLTVAGHALTINEMPSHDHVIRRSAWQNGSGEPSHYQGDSTGSADGLFRTEDRGGGATHSHGITSNSSYRPLAAVGTMQFPNLA